MLPGAAYSNSPSDDTRAATRGTRASSHSPIAQDHSSSGGAPTSSAGGGGRESEAHRGPRATRVATGWAGHGCACRASRRGDSWPRARGRMRAVAGRAGPARRPGAASKAAGPPPDHSGDLLFGVVEGGRQVVGEHAVGAVDDEVADIPLEVLPAAPLHEILYPYRAGARPHPDRACASSRRHAIATGARIHAASHLPPRAGTGKAVATGLQRFEGGRIEAGARTLVDDFTIPVQPQAFQLTQNGGDGAGGRPEARRCRRCAPAIRRRGNAHPESSPPRRRSIRSEVLPSVRARNVRGPADLAAFPS